MKKCLILLLVLLLALSSGGCMSTAVLYQLIRHEANAYVPETVLPQPAVKPPASAAPQPAAPPDAAPPDASAVPAPDADPRESVRFSDMEYVRPDTDAVIQQLNALIGDTQAGTAPETWLARFDEALAHYDNADSQLSLAYLLYAFDVTEDYYQDEYEQLELALLEIDVLLADAAVAILGSPEKGAEASAQWGPDFVETVYLSDRLNSYEIQDQLKQEIALELRYDEMLTTFVLKDGNRTWTLEDLAPAYYAGQIDYEEYYRLYDAYCAAFNKDAGQLFSELTELRSLIASKLGYGSFAAYRYDSYERDFTLEEAAALHKAVKETLVPLYTRASIAYQYDLWELSERTFPLAPYLKKLQGVASDFSGRLAESLQYMLDNELYDFTVSEKKMEGSFTTYIGNYRAPFIFSQWDDTSGGVSTVIHELGHFTNDYYNPSVGWSGGYSLDLAEVDSQGLELLATRYYDVFYDKLSEVAEADMLLNSMYAILSGCMEDEFQQYAYQHPDATLAQRNEKYLALAAEYGFMDLYGYTGTEWTLIPHTFQSPMYYISYATSMLLSLELWAQSKADFDAARDAYWSILDRAPYARFRTVANESGLADPLSPDTVRSLAGALETALFPEIG